MATPPRLAVRHCVVCLGVEVDRAGPDNPYTLRGVSYALTPDGAVAGRVWFSELWLYTRYFADQGRYDGEASLFWLDGPDGQEELLTLPLPAVVVPPGREGVSRAYKLLYLPAPGPGRYMFRLRFAGVVLAEEFYRVPEVVP